MESILVSRVRSYALGKNNTRNYCFTSGSNVWSITMDVPLDMFWRSQGVWCRYTYASGALLMTLTSQVKNTNVGQIRQYRRAHDLNSRLYRNTVTMIGYTLCPNPWTAYDNYCTPGWHSLGNQALCCPTVGYHMSVPGYVLIHMDGWVWY